VLKPLIDWLDHRAGVRKFTAAMLLEGVPGGAKWRYVWGSCLAFVFSIQLITGLLLMTAYSPSSSQAWSSVHFIQYQMDFGWLIRGLHHFGSQTMMVLLALHLLQVVIAGAHLKPREVNWWLGMGLLGVTFGLSLTGYLLPWDQKGYWATRVATNIASNIPVLGDDIKQLAVGGPDYGNHTLTRFYALHVGILPLILIVLLVAHVVIFRRHGVTSAANVEGLVTKPENEHGAELFWPRQAFYDMLACMVVFGIMFGLVLYGFGQKVDPPAAEKNAERGFYDQWAKAGQQGKGADLDAPADRDTPNYPARPEWYFLFLFQLLKYFPGEQILIGTVFIPNGVMLLLTLLPLFGYGPMRKFGHFLGVLVIMTLLILVGMLTLFALRDDSEHGILWGTLKNTETKDIEKAHTFEKSVKEAEALAKRACQMAMDGTPVEGGHVLLRNDPKTAGRKLFEVKCGSCHSFSAQKPFPDPDSRNDFFDSWIPKDKDKNNTATASDLGDFGTAAWVRSLLKNPMDAKHFGNVKTAKKNENGEIDKDKDGKPVPIHVLEEMKGWREEIDKLPADQIAKRESNDFAQIAAWLADQANPREKRDVKVSDAGQAAFFDKTNRCASCHKIEKKEDAGAGKFTFEIRGGSSGPILANYGSAEWIRGMIMNPGHKSRYNKNNTMPAFRNTDGPGADVLMQEFRGATPAPTYMKEISIQHLSDIEREMIIRWMLRDYRAVYGGATIAK
jgi:quinol-cytochrome oxidoreductase complex cytochrome b subunit/cytochrome c2